jgi:predicted NAD-dependent protein-ADP-ribosyltransferase YbiA (DUF1768 family)
MNKPPFIIAFFDGTPEGKLLSNFAHTPFELDGVRYETVEGFWQSLKTEIVKIRTELAECTDGFTAKKIGRTISSAKQLFTYENHMYRVGSAAHHQLLERAIRAKVAQHTPTREALVASHPHPLRHMLLRNGRWVGGDSPALPAVVFERILTTVRTELLESTFQETLPLPEDIFTEE